MKLSNILLGAAALSCLAACEMKDELTGGSTKTDMGLLRLDVQAQMPAAMTRAEVSTAKFPVTIVGLPGTATEEESKSYATVEEVPAEILLPVGQYTVSSHTPGTLEKIMDAPYYGGETAMTITKDVTTQTTVKCRMQNSRIRMSYSADFLTAFSSWTITLDDGKENGVVLTYTEKEPNPVDQYVYFGEEVATITINIRAVTSEKGETVSVSYSMTKADASEGYEDIDNGSFVGGDALNINLKPTEYTTGKIPGIEVEADITFSEYDESVTIPVEGGDSNTGGGDDPSPSTPSGDGPSIELPANRTYTKEEAKVTTDEAMAILKAPAGFSVINVNISSSSSVFIEDLSEMDLINFDLVENEIMPEVFAMAKLTEYGVPKTGDVEYEFPIHAFFQFLYMYVGEHTFRISIEDEDGNKISDELIITITE